MIIFLDLYENETIELWNQDVDFIEWTEEGIIITNVDGLKFLAKEIETC